MHLSPSVDLDIDRGHEKNTKSEDSIMNESSSSNKRPVPIPTPHPEFKRRKRHRRKHFENQEACVMRGVYFKNMKWQAAIKVDKKQIHLGTVSSQEEAACLYDSLNAVKSLLWKGRKSVSHQNENKYFGTECRVFQGLHSYITYLYLI